MRIFKWTIFLGLIFAVGYLVHSHFSLLNVIEAMKHEPEVFLDVHLPAVKPSRLVELESILSERGFVDSEIAEHEILRSRWQRASADEPTLETFFATRGGYGRLELLMELKRRGLNDAEMRDFMRIVESCE